MGRAYGIDLRARVVDAIEGGLSHRQAAKRFCIAVSTAGNWSRLWRKTGSARPGKQGHPVGSKLDAYEAEILAMVEENRDIALYEITERLAGEHGICTAPSTVFNPIEMAYGKIKALLRKAAARTIDGLWDAIAVAIEHFPPSECRNYFAAAGYDHE